MEEGETTSLSKKELHKQKLMEYLKAKGKFKEPTTKPNLQDVSQVKKTAMSSLKATGKENKTSERFGSEQKKTPLGAKKTAHLGAKSAVCPVTKVLGVHNKENSDICLPVCHYAKHLTAPNKPLDRTLSKTIQTVVKTSNRNFGRRYTSTLPCPIRTFDSRISFGPLVKTKTGLVPAVTKVNQNKRHTSITETALTRSVVNKSAPRDRMTVTASRGSTILSNMKKSVSKSLDEERTAVSSTKGAKIKSQGQNKASTNLHLDKTARLSKVQQTNHQKSISNSHKCTTTADKNDGRLSRCSKSTTQPANVSKNPKSEVKMGGKGQQYVLPSRTSRSAVVHRTKDEQVQKNKMATKKDDKVGRGSAIVQPQQRTRVARPGRAGSSTSQSSSTRVTVPDTLIPQTDGKKQTAAQAERMKKLQEWREAKGISYKRPPLPVKPQAKRTVTKSQPFCATMKGEDEAHSLICAVDRSLADCVKLLGEGCPPGQVKAVLSRLPAVSRKFAKYWICQARLMEREGNLEVLPLFEEAVSIVLEPVDELRTVVFEILKKKDEAQAEDNNEEKGDGQAEQNTPDLTKEPMTPPQPVRALIYGEKGDSSVVKYKITATPGCPHTQPKEPARVNGQEVRFFTPVRRSVRIEKASLRYPASLQDHDLCVASYSELISKEDKGRIEEELADEISPSTPESPMYVYRENDALKDKVFVKLVYQDDA
ncbi:cytoskeleton-associated protein 2-like isoform X1 [Takifugu flavidus]|uniref:Cytoskeleton-associated protein 2-like n=1 Tax=Takifugu flavidus TaxID=433684 RepID=A0A5C6N3A3_9TELE|nr:cytoskeleton-associated protein 2-like isoform X1 [Takifugu flavidus]TWW60180.1 Cytoskeleton-associated protein 2-like [Takifugu flavidus]